MIKVEVLFTTNDEGGDYADSIEEALVDYFDRSSEYSDEVESVEVYECQYTDEQEKKFRLFQRRLLEEMENVAYDLAEAMQIPFVEEDLDKALSGLRIAVRFYGPEFIKTHTCKREDYPEIWAAAAEDAIE